MKSNTIQSLLKLNSAFITTLEVNIAEMRVALRDPRSKEPRYAEQVTALRHALSKLRKKLKVQVDMQKTLKVELHQAYAKERFVAAILAQIGIPND